jgi:hypothetical protein
MTPRNPKCQFSILCQAGAIKQACQSVEQMKLSDFLLLIIRQQLASRSEQPFAKVFSLPFFDGRIVSGLEVLKSSG